jgi:hypothetical protein
MRVALFFVFNIFPVILTFGDDLYISPCPFGYYTPAPLKIALYTSLSILLENTDSKNSPCMVYFLASRLFGFE